jgi:hypothetical protein
MLHPIGIAASNANAMVDRRVLMRPFLTWKDW